MQRIIKDKVSTREKLINTIKCLYDEVDKTCMIFQEGEKRNVLRLCSEGDYFSISIINEEPLNSSNEWEDMGYKDLVGDEIDSIESIIDDEFYDYMLEEMTNLNKESFDTYYGSQEGEC